MNENENGNGNEKDPEVGGTTPEQNPAEGVGNGGQKDKAEGEKKQPTQEAKHEGKSELEYKFNFADGDEVNDVYVKEFSSVAKELSLSQEQAQKLMDLNVKQQNADREKLEKQVNEQAEAYKEEAVEKLGDKFNETLSYAAKALDKYDSKGELRRVLNVLPIGNNVELIRVFARMGKDIAEDKLVQGGSTSGEKSIEERLYPTHKK